MATYLKNQGGWKLAQIRSSDEESRKRTGEELQIESSKKLKSDTREDVSVPKEKDKESVNREEGFKIKKVVLRYTKRKSLARKGLQKKPEFGTEEDVEAYMEEIVDEPSSEEFSMSSIPQGPAHAKIVKWQIIKIEKRGVVFGDDVGSMESKRPEEEFERVLWGDLKTIVHCLTVEATHIYMLTEVKYPLPPRVCKAMLEKKLLGDRKDEVCYQLLKLIEKQAQQHKDWLVQEQAALGKDCKI
ncbi:hypothetical protein Tco_0414079 [Tanacetum coccineum]